MNVSYAAIIGVALRERKREREGEVVNRVLVVSRSTRKKYDNIENVVCSFGTYPKSF